MKNKFARLGQPNATISALSLSILILATSLYFGFLGRTIFLAASDETITFLQLCASFLRGLLFDLAVGSYFLLPFTPIFLLPRRLWESFPTQLLLFSLFLAEFTLLIFTGASEWFFAEEFHSRFNFIAVDYLVYTNEVLKNIWESYPVWLIAPAIFGISAFSVRWLFFKFSRARAYRSWAHRCALAILICAFSGFSLFALNENSLLKNLASVEAETSKNGIHALFAAYQNNEIDYGHFYSSNGTTASEHLVYEAMEQDYPDLQRGNSPANEDKESIARNIVSTKQEKKLNVVLVLMESMSARFMKAYGSDKAITPNLDNLAQKGLFFDRLYATGTRTVRGIEAVVLSMPPTPGQSIVRRPDAGELFSIGTVFREKGYRTEFVYGGRSYFDNMKTFFRSNKFDVSDEENILPSDRTFSNAWGVADEDLFRHALKLQSENYQHGRPFFQLILTTSNHRPYTFPKNKIDLQPGTGRDGAVKYSDFSIGEFVAESAQKPWFKNTVYVFVADHNASVAGGTKVLPADYRIPAIFYSPGNISPEKNSILSSQIDIAPTLLGLLNFSYQSKFFGHDLSRAKTERAFLGTYQTVGLWRHDKLVLLSPNFRIDIKKMKNEIAQNLFRLEEKKYSAADEDVAVTIAFYETASTWYQEKLLKESRRYSTVKNMRAF